MEIVTLLIPAFNDSEEELKRLTEFLVSVSPDIPWHVTAFHKDYKMTDPENTRPEDLIRAAEIGKKAARYIYGTDGAHLSWAEGVRLVKWLVLSEVPGLRAG